MTSIDTLTSEQLLRVVANLHKTHGGNAADLVATAARSLGCQTELASFGLQTIINSAQANIDRAERQALAAADNFESVGQMSLFGDLISEHSIPKGWKTKYTKDVIDWWQSRAEIDRANAEEMMRHAEQAQRKAKHSEYNASVTHQVGEALERAGLDPAQVTYEQAIAHAETFHARGGPATGASSSKPLR